MCLSTAYTLVTWGLEGTINPEYARVRAQNLRDAAQKPKVADFIKKLW